MLQYHTFYKKDRLIVTAAYVLLEAALLFHFYTRWNTMRTVDGVGNGWLMMNPLSDFLVLGASVVMAGYFGVCLVAGWRTPRRYVFAMAVWAAVFLLSGSLFPFLFGLSSGENAGIFGQVIPIILWVIIFTVGLKGFLQMLRSSPDGISVEQQSEIPIQKANFDGENASMRGTKRDCRRPDAARRRRIRTGMEVRKNRLFCGKSRELLLVFFLTNPPVPCMIVLIY